MGLSNVICLIFSTSGYTGFNAFSEINLTEDMINCMESRVKMLQPGDKMALAFQNITKKPPAKFDMLPGFRASLKRVSQLISTLDLKLFEEIKLETEKGLTLPAPSSAPRKVLATGGGQMIELDQNFNYAEKMIEALVKIVKIASPHIANPVIKMVEDKRTSKCISFKVQCGYCESEKFLTVYARLTNGYFALTTANFMRHIEKQHDEPGRRLIEAKVSLEPSFTQIIIYFSRNHAKMLLKILLKMTSKITLKMIMSNGNMQKVKMPKFLINKN